MPKLDTEKIERKMRSAGKIVFLTTSLILIILNLSVWIQDNHAFSIKSVLVSGASLLDTREILSAAEINGGAHVMEADVKSIRKRLQNLPEVENVRISRVFPSSIRIEVEERRPVALIIDNGIWGIDAEGILLPRFGAHHGLDYPVIIDQRLGGHTPGRVIKNTRVLKLVRFLGNLQQTQPSVYALLSEVSFSEVYGMKAMTIDKNIPIYFGQGNYLEKCENLEAAWQYLQLSGKLTRLRYLDLRYEGQIVARQHA